MGANTPVGTPTGLPRKNPKTGGYGMRRIPGNGTPHHGQQEASMPRRRMLGAALALTLTVSGAALVSGVQAWAATGPHGKVVCTTITGNISNTITVSGC